MLKADLKLYRAINKSRKRSAGRMKRVAQHNHTAFLFSEEVTRLICGGAFSSKRISGLFKYCDYYPNIMLCFIELMILRGHYKEALKLCNRSKEQGIFSKSKILRQELEFLTGCSYLKLNRYVRAIRNFQACLKMGGQHPMVHSYMALCEQKRDKSLRAPEYK